MDFNALASSMDVGWTLIAAALVFFMQAGFAMVETGFTRAKNAGNIIMKNLMDFSLGTPIFWLLGFGIMFGSMNGFFGGFDFLADGVVGEGYNWTTLIFQTVFCATAATIVSGSMAERTKFSAYCIYSMVISAIIYPISGHWIWGGGWLAELGFHDFAGSTAVHMVGGVAAFVGAAILGPRIGKYTKDGKARAIPGHSLTLGALGVFILWFCWFGFNGGSTVALSGEGAEVAARVFVTTNMAAAVATVTVMCITWIRYKKPDVSMTLNGSLAGLVAITAGCDTVTPFGSAIIGIIAGFVVVFGIEFVDQKLKVDDPVGAVGVHGLCGATGTLMVGLFGYYAYGSTEVAPVGLFYGGGVHALAIQALGVVAVIAWVAITMTVVFQIIKHTIGLRVSEAEEIMGLDKPEHGLSSAYADFMPFVPNVLGTKAAEKEASMLDTIPVAVEKAVPVTKVTTEGGDHKLTKIVIVTKQSKFEVLKDALGAIGVSGMTVTNVIGCGVQKGAAEYYRGAEVDVTLLPKIKMEVVAPEDTYYELMRKKISIELQELMRTGTLPEGYPAGEKADAAAVHCDNVARAHVKSSAAVLDLLSKKYPLVMITNFYGNMRTVIREYGILGYFSDIVESATAGFRKPSPEIFRMACGRLGTAPAETLMVGDSYKNDIAPAIKLGMQAIWLKNESWNNSEENIEYEKIIRTIEELPAMV